MTLYNADQMAEADASTGNRLVTDTMAKRFHFLDRIGHKWHTGHNGHRGGYIGRLDGRSRELAAKDLIAALCGMVVAASLVVVSAISTTGTTSSSVKNSPRFSLSSVSSFSYPAPGDIATFAGSGTPCADAQTTCGNLGPAIQADLNSPDGVSVAPSGAVIIADTYDNKIRMVASSSCLATSSSPCPYGFSSPMTEGSIYTVAGNGQSFQYPPGGDGGKATGASLTYPFSSAEDANGNIYIADSGDYAIRRVDASTGVITTVAGNGTMCPSPSTNPCGDGGPAIDAELNFPVSLVVDKTGNLIISDTLDNRVRMVAAHTCTISATTSCPYGTSTTTGYIYTIAGTGASCTPSYAGGPALDACLENPEGLAFGPNGDLYIVDSGIGHERVVELATYDHTQWGISMTADHIYTVAGNGNKAYSGDGGPATKASFDFPRSIAVDSAGNLYIAEFDNRVREVAAKKETEWGISMQPGYIYTVIGNGAQCTPSTNPCGDGGPVSSAQLHAPFGIAIGPSGHIYIADTFDNRIRVATPSSALPIPGPSQQSLGTGPTGAANVNTCIDGDAVVCSSGDFSLREVDFSIPGFGGGLSLSRTYNSIDSSLKGPFGYGWASSVSAQLSVGSSGYVTITQPGGSQVSFAPSSSGYIAAGFVLATLRHNANGTWTYTRKARQIFTFSPSGELISTSDLNGSTTTYAYNSSGMLLSVADPSGRLLSFSYNPAGFVASVTGPSGESVTYSYDQAGNLTSVTNQAGHVTKFGYNSSHLMTTVVDPDGDTTTNSYNSSGQVISQIDPLGGITTYSYSGDPFSATGSTTTITYPDANVEIQRYQYGALVEDTLGADTSSSATWRYTLDPTTLETTSVTDPNGDTTSFTYDSAGNMTSVTNPLGDTTTSTFNSFDEPTSVTDPAGVTTTYTYDARGNLISSSTPLSAGSATTTLFHQNPAHPGEITALTNPNGATWKFSYDAYGNLSSVTNPLGDTTTTAYNVLSEPTSLRSPTGGITRYSYTPTGELASSTNPLGDTTNYVYDKDGNLIAETDPLGRTTSYLYNAMGENTATIYPNGTETKTTYDQNGNATSYTNQDGETTSYSFNSLNRLVSTTNPLGETTSYGYDSAGNLVSVTSPSGIITTLGYNIANELTGISYSDGTHPVSYSYNAMGEVSSMTDATGTSTYTYDNLGHLISETNGAGATIGYAYDPAGNPISITYPNNKTVTETYNAAGELSSITDWLGNVTKFSYDPAGDLVATTYPNGTTETRTYNLAGEPTSITAKDSNNRGCIQILLPHFGHTCNILSIHYSYNSASDITSYGGSGQFPTGSSTYSYTSTGELASSNPSVPSPPALPGIGNLMPPTGTQNILGALGTSYSYDPAGNLTTATGPGPLKSSLSYNNAGELTTMTSGIGELLGATASYSYNSSGQRTEEQVSSVAGKGPSLSYSFDAAGDLSSYAGPYGGSPISVAASFPPGMGESVSGHPGNAISQSYLYNGAGLLSSIVSATTKRQPSHRVPSSSASTTELTWDTAGTTPVVIEKNNAYFIYGPQGLPIEEIYSPTTNSAGSFPTVLYYLQDALGSTRALSGSNGTVVARYSYSPYGSLICEAGIGINASCANGLPPAGMSLKHVCRPPGKTTHKRSPLASGAIPGPISPPPTCISRALNANPFYFAGQYLNKASSLYYLRARWYDPATAQFISVDPLVNVTHQPYQYVGDNPVSNTDPTGECVTCAQLALAITAILGLVAISALILGAALGPFAEEAVVIEEETVANTASVSAFLVAIANYAQEANAARFAAYLVAGGTYGVGAVALSGIAAFAACE